MAVSEARKRIISWDRASDETACSYYYNDKQRAVVLNDRINTPSFTAPLKRSIILKIQHLSVIIILFLLFFTRVVKSTIMNIRSSMRLLHTKLPTNSRHAREKAFERRKREKNCS